MLTIPDHFFTRRLQGEYRLTNQQTGRLDVNALIAGRSDFWQLPDDVSLVPRALILCDWTIQSSPEGGKTCDSCSCCFWLFKKKQVLTLGDNTLAIDHIDYRIHGLEFYASILLVIFKIWRH